MRTRLATAAAALALLSPAAVDAQAWGSISGVVRDAVSDAPVSDARVALDGVSRSAATDAGGRFVLSQVDAGVYTLRVTRLGYEQLVVAVGRVLAGEELDLDLEIAPRAIALEDLVVSPGAFSFMASSPATRQTMSRAEIESVPQFGEDIFRAVNRLPGLTSGDYAARFSIRGGRPDQNLVLLDGLEIYEPYHLKDFNDGAFSILDVETIGGVELMTGGFPAKYGNRASGVFTITSKEPDPGGPRYGLGLSFMNARAMAEGSIAGGRGSWLVSARRGYLDLLLDLLKQIDLPSPRYHDVFAKAAYALSPEHELSIDFLHGADHYVFDAGATTGYQDTINTRELANNRYGNSYVWANLRSLLGERTLVNGMVSAGRVTSSRDGTEYYLDAPGALYAVESTRSFDVLGVKQDWRFEWTDAVSLSWGFDARRLTADYARTDVVGQNPDDPSDDTLSYYPHTTSSSLTRDGTTLGSYGSVRLAPVRPLVLEVGIRHDRGSYTGDRDPSPRVNALVRLPGANNLRLAWGHFRQMQGIADVEALQGPMSYFPSELSEQWIAGFEHEITGGGLFRVEGYLKSGSYPRPVFRSYRGGLDVFPESSEDWILVHPDSVESKGLEAFWRQTVTDELSVTTSYGLAWATEWTSAIDNVNVPVPMEFRVRHGMPQDQRHTVSLDVAFRPSASWTIHGSWAFHTGWPGTTERLVAFSPPGGGVDYALRPDSLYGNRFPAYQRLDVRVTKRITRARGDLRLFFEVTNLTNHENVFGYDYYRAPAPGSGWLSGATTSRASSSCLPSG